MTVFVGTSGWQYRDWRGSFYPEKLPQRLWLEHYVERFATVEVNNTFYRLPPPETFAAWAKRMPPDFVMVLKLSRYLTHIKQLRDPGEPVERFLRHAAPLGARTGPLLLQLPPTLQADLPRLTDTLDRFPTGVRVAVEPRHDTWFTDATAAALRERNAAFCLADRGSKVLGPLWRTADWGYVRFHEGRASPRPCYGEAALATWAERLASMWAADEDVYCFFNNDPNACAVRDAVVFAGCLRTVDREPTRVPRVEEVRVHRG